MKKIKFRLLVKRTFSAMINAASFSEGCTIAVSIGLLWSPGRCAKLILPDFRCSFYFGETKDNGC